MPASRRPLEITLERVIVDPHGGAPITVRVTARFEPPSSGSGSEVASLSEEIGRLRGELDSAVATIAPGAGPSRADRPLEELVEAYRPRQPELLELLRDEGELTVGEYETLRRHLDPPGSARPPPAGIPITERPIAAAPLETDRSPSTPRPVDDLIRQFQIGSLKQAGAVRARRQISFEEYMSLKRHFAAQPLA